MPGTVIGRCFLFATLRGSAIYIFVIEKIHVLYGASLHPDAQE